MILRRNWIVESKQGDVEFALATMFVMGIIVGIIGSMIEFLVLR